VARAAQLHDNTTNGRVEVASMRGTLLTGSRRRGPAAKLFAALATAVALVGLAAPAAQADFRIESFTTEATTYEAGAHADVSTTFAFSDAGEDPFDGMIPDGHSRRIEIDLPHGLVGDPTKFPRCTREQFRALGCPAASQVGIATLTLAARRPDEVVSAVFNVEPSANEPALFGIDISQPTIRSFVRINVRPDGGLQAVVDDLPYGTALIRSRMTLWGVPADHNGSGAERRPFMSNGTACEEPVTTLRAWSYEDGDRVFTATSRNQIGENCDTLTFDPTMTATPTQRAAGGPTGLDVAIDVPQGTHPDGRATAHVRGVQIVLPEGMSVSPSSANGLQACLPSQFGYRTNSSVTCPEASKIGSVNIVSPLVDQPLTGSVFLAKQNDNPFSSLLAIYIVAQGQGVTIKLAGKVDPDPVTGRLTTTFSDNPQLPFSRFELSFKSGPRAPLYNPRVCGRYESETRITSWAGHVVSARTPMVIDQDCQPVGFAPSFSAGTLNPAGGKSSTFSLTFGRSDHDQELRDISVSLPTGLTGKLAEAEPCADALVAAGACGEASRVGTVTTASGPGTTPYHLPGRAYLTGPYNGAPLGMAFVVPAVAGPFDLGTVVVRSGIHVDRHTAALRVVSDPLPRILQGIPLQVRSVNVAVDKPGFMLNPTSCAPKQIRARVSSQQGAGADVSSRFQAGGCGSLPLKPKMTIAVGGRGRTRANTTVPFTATLTQTPGQTNLRQVAVNLPFSLASRLEAVATSAGCTPEVFDAERCTVPVGEATAVSPLLRDPLRGKVFLVRNPARRLPDLMVRLRATGWTSGIVIDLTGHVKIERDLTIRTTFMDIPDVPITRFRLSLVPGRYGVIRTVPSLCSQESRSGRAKLGFRGQNGRYLAVKQRMKISGCRAARRGSARSGSGRRGSARRGSARAKKRSAPKQRAGKR
jgi:hypothetical protein